MSNLLAAGMTVGDRALTLGYISGPEHIEWTRFCRTNWSAVFELPELERVTAVKSFDWTLILKILPILAMLIPGVGPFIAFIPQIMEIINKIIEMLKVIPVNPIPVNPTPLFPPGPVPDPS